MFCCLSRSGIFIIIDFYSELDKTFNIVKEGQPMLSNSSQLYPSETYPGSENTIVMETLMKATFVCTFSDIGNYPFNSETCYFKLFISGSDNRFTNLQVASITDKGQNAVDEYEIKTWTVEKSNVTTGAKGKSEFCCKKYFFSSISEHFQD